MNWEVIIKWLPKLAQGATLEVAMRRANAAAALSVTGTGAIGGMPTQAQVRALLATI